MYLTELRRDADTYHMVWSQEATPIGTGNQYEFSGGVAFGIVVDDELAAMSEDSRLREVFKRARQHVRDEQEKASGGADPTPQPTPGRGTGTE